LSSLASPPAALMAASTILRASACSSAWPRLVHATNAPNASAPHKHPRMTELLTSKEGENRLALRDLLTGDSIRRQARRQRQTGGGWVCGFRSSLGPRRC